MHAVYTQDATFSLGEVGIEILGISEDVKFFTVVYIHRWMFYDAFLLEHLLYGIYEHRLAGTHLAAYYYVGCKGLAYACCRHSTLMFFVASHKVGKFLLDIIHAYYGSKRSGIVVCQCRAAPLTIVCFRSIWFVTFRAIHIR